MNGPDVATALISFAILVLSLTFHEAAHAWTADRLGDPTPRMMGRLSLNPIRHIDWIGTVLFPLVGMFSGLPLFGWAKPVQVNARNFRVPPRDFAMVALAGPVSNLLLALTGAAALLPLRASMRTGDAGIVAGLLTMLIIVNVLLAVFNLIPVPPLDGSNVLLGIGSPGLARAMAQIRPYGFLILYALLLSGALDRLMSPVMVILQAWLYG